MNDEKEERIESIRKFNQYMQSLLSEDELEKFQKLGEKLYNSFDVYKGELIQENNDKSVQLEEALAYVVESMKSGLHPKYLTEDEIFLLKAAYGDNWYEKWNYTKEELY